MIKITIKTTANYTSCSSRITITLLLLSLFGLTACAPIALPRLPIQLPQSYPAQQPPVVMQPQQRPQPIAQSTQRNTSQNTRVVPKAGALISAPVQVAQAPGRTVPQRPKQQVRQRVQQASRVAPATTVQRQVQQVTVPPVLNPVQQARVSNTVRPDDNNRPTASVRVPVATTQSRQPIWEDIPRQQAIQTAPAQKKTVAVRRPSASVRNKPTAVAKPAVPNLAQTKPARTEQPQSAQTEVEVLDLSGSLAKNASVAQEKPTAAVSQPRSYNSSPAVAVLTKQANNQLTVGKAGRAAATLERALRIEPDNPALWLRLAEVNAQQGRKSQAASMARKALNLAPGDTGLQARAKRLMN